MIVTSKRCFLNILTQLWPAERLLNANYYVGDQRTSSNYTQNVNINSQVSFDQFGQLVRNSTDHELPQVFAGRYNIKTSDCLNPEPFRVESEYVMGASSQSGMTCEERFKKNNLDNPDTFLNVYKFLFREPLAGNGIQILMFNDYENMLRFGGIICEYLSVNFGVDIVFLDRLYNDKCSGMPNYVGNKELGIKTIRDIRDYEMVSEFAMSVTQSTYTGSVANITMLLSTFEFNELMRLYHLLYPNDPIPPGNYTEEHIREILISRATANMKVDHMFSNITLQDWTNILDRIDNENVDFGQDGGLY
jgi:hypothetical protein